MNIELKAVQDLRPYANNARTHSKRQVRQIAKSIEKFGFCNPVLIDDKDGMIAGHGRVEAAKLLGIEAVPTCRLSHLSEADKRAYILADNKIASAAGWDKDMLAIELQGLAELNVDLDLTGFEMADIDLLLEEVREAKGAATAPEDVVPEIAPNPATTRCGDLWLLGEHRLHCADAREHAAYDRLLDGSKAQFVFTDPPDTAIDRREMTDVEFAGLLNAVVARLVDNSVDGSIHQICLDWRHMGEMLTAGRAVFTELKNLCVWNKTNAGMGSFYRSKHELVFVWKNGTAPHINNLALGQHGRSRANVWDYAGHGTPKARRLNQLHPTVKPVALVADALKDCSRRNGLVLDPFCGSGTIVIAAERTGRKARALEIDPIHVDVTVRRWQAYTGKSAVLANSGETFETVEEQRRLAAA